MSCSACASRVRPRTRSRTRGVVGDNQHFRRAGRQIERSTVRIRRQRSAWPPSRARRRPGKSCRPSARSACHTPSPRWPPTSGRKLPAGADCPVRRNHLAHRQRHRRLALPRTHRCVRPRVYPERIAAHRARRSRIRLECCAAATPSAPLDHVLVPAAPSERLGRLMRERSLRGQRRSRRMDLYPRSRFEKLLFGSIHDDQKAALNVQAFRLRASRRACRVQRGDALYDAQAAAAWKPDYVSSLLTKKAQRQYERCCCRRRNGLRTTSSRRLKSMRAVRARFYKAFLRIRRCAPWRVAERLPDGSRRDTTGPPRRGEGTARTDKRVSCRGGISDAFADFEADLCYRA